HLPEKHPEARRILKELIQKDTEQLNARLTLARMLVEDRATTEAIPHLEYILKRDPHRSGALFLLSQAYISGGRIADGKMLAAEYKRASAEEEGLTDLQVRAVMQPEDFASRLTLAERYIGRGQYGSAL